MNLKDFSLMGEDQDSYTIGHPKGRSIKIDKSGISEMAHEHIKKMSRGGSVPAYADGTPDGGAAVPINVNQPQIPENLVAAPQETPFQNQLDQEASQEQAQTAADNLPYGTSNPPSSAGPSPASMPDQMPATDAGPALAPPQFPDVAKSLSAEESAIQGGAQAETAEAQQNKQDLADYFNQSQKEYADQKLRYQQFQDKDAALEKAVMDNRIDPQKYWTGTNGHSKVLAGIGLVLSGLGSGLTGQPNMAAEMIQKGIEREVDAQKNDQSNSMNLWKMNREAYGNDLQASLATQNQLLAGVNAKAKMAAATAQGPLVQARIAPLIQQIEAQKATHAWQMSMMNPGSQSGGVFKADPAQIVDLMPGSPETKKAALDEIGKKQYLNQNYDQMMALYNKAEEENTVLGRAGRFGAEPPSIKALRTLADPLLKDKDGRPSEILSDHFNAILPGWGERASTSAENKQNFHSWLTQGPPAPFSKSLGIDLNRFQSTAPRTLSKYTEGQTAVNSNGQRAVFSKGRWVPLNGG